MAKIGLVLEGGGMKCAYGAGVLDAFLDYDIHFDYCIGVSAGSANAASYLAGQRGRNLRFYTTHIHEPGYFGVHSLRKTGNLFGLEHIYGTLTNKGGSDELDYDALMANPTEYYIVATDAATGQPAYFTKVDLKPDDYRPIMASSAIPAVCRPITIGDKQYFDGGLSDAIPVKKALEDGCDKLVVILSKPRGYRRKPEKHRPVYAQTCRSYPNTVKAIDNRYYMYHKCQTMTYELERRGRAFLFAPSKPMKMSTYAMDAEANRQLYELGLQDVATAKDELMEFLGRD